MNRVVANSRHVEENYSGKPRTMDQLPRIPINMVLALMKEAVSYPEVMEAYRALDNLKPRYGQGKQYREENLLMWFDQYLIHKYGNMAGGKNKIILTFEPKNATIIPLRKIARGEFEG